MHTDAELKVASQYLVYHVKMFVETRLWLDQNPSSGGWETQRNGILEAFLVHARVLIDFVSNDRPGARPDDVIGIDYFHDNRSAFTPLTDKFLGEQADHIGGHLVHITKKPMPDLKSNQSWPVDKICSTLVPALQNFFNQVPAARVEAQAKAESLHQLARLSPPRVPPVSLSAST